MTAPRKNFTRYSFTVTLDVPIEEFVQNQWRTPGKAEVAQYVREAVSTWGGSKHPDSWQFDVEKVRVK